MCDPDRFAAHTNKDGEYAVEILVYQDSCQLCNSKICLLIARPSSQSTTIYIAGCEFNRERVIDETPLVFTAVAGSLAVLPCSVDPRYAELYSDQYKVIWVSPVETVISLQDLRIINDIRMSVERPYLKNWNLLIRNVSLLDAGVYKCQINTDPVGTKKIKLVVTDPPNIIDHSMPNDVKKLEGEKVELFCNATGSPTPDISWYRLHKKVNGKRERIGKTGESLVIHNISRKCGDYYECVASNGVEPAISHTFKVTVHFSPAVNLPNSRIGQQVGKDTILDCEVSASPLGQALWKRHERSLENSPFHEIHLYSNTHDDNITLSLRILKVESEDFGFYECEASNSLGVATKSMELFELVSKTSPATRPTRMTTSKQVWINDVHDKEIIEVDIVGDIATQKSNVNQSQTHSKHSNHHKPYNSSNGSFMSGYQSTWPSNHEWKYSGAIGIRKDDTTSQASPSETMHSLFVSILQTLIIQFLIII